MLHTISISETTPSSAAAPAISRPVPFDEADENRFVERLIANEGAAWREFRIRYDRLILRCITNVTKRFARVSAEDVREIYATLFMSLLVNERAKLRNFDPSRGNRFSSWVGLLAVHAAYDYLRAVRREPLKQDLTAASFLPTTADDPYAHVEQHERRQMARTILARFSRRDQTFAALYFGEGLAPDEIARRMKISVKTVYSKKHKIQSRLEALVGRIAA